MRRLFITAASATALLVSGALTAASQEKPATGDPRPSAGAIKQEPQSITPDRSIRSGDAATTKSQERNNPAASRSGDRDSDGGSYKSYKRSSGKFSGKIAGGYSADNLIGTNIKNLRGKTVGKVHDLLIGPDNEVTKVIVEVGGFLGIGSRTVAVDIEQLTRKGQEKDLILAMSKEQVENMPEYKESGGTWVRQGSNKSGTRDQVKDQKDPALRKKE